MAPEIDQTVSSRSDFLLQLFRRQCPKQFVRAFHVGLPAAERGADERPLCIHSFSCLSFGKIACPQSTCSCLTWENYPPRSAHGGSSPTGVATLRGPHDPAG